MGVEVVASTPLAHFHTEIHKDSEIEEVAVSCYLISGSPADQDFGPNSQAWRESIYGSISLGNPSRFYRWGRGETISGDLAGVGRGSPKCASG